MVLKKRRWRRLRLLTQVGAAVRYSFQQFVATNSLGGLCLLATLLAALAWANSPWQASYHAVWHDNYIGVTWNGHIGKLSLGHWINDGLMAIFFFVVGLEIKRELLVGELSDWRKALLPVVAALGGIIAPALCYSLLQPSPETMRGWAIPTATDIAFALGILSLLGSRAPVALKIFLTALAIVDDIGAILLIGIFYSAPPQWQFVGAAAVVFLLMLYCNRRGVSNLVLYQSLAVVLWLAFLLSGIHATLAGVLAALAVPARVDLSRKASAAQGSELAEQLQELSASKARVLGDATYHRVLGDMAALARSAGAPLQRLENQLHPFVAYGILPLFALANGGITLEGDLLGSLREPLALGIMAGLYVGKPLGIVSVCWLLHRFKLVSLPEGLGWPQLIAGGFFAGIGFTMSIFIAGLAFHDPATLAQAKLAILLASALSALTGLVLLLRQPHKPA